MVFFTATPLGVGLVVAVLVAVVVGNNDVGMDVVPIGVVWKCVVCCGRCCASSCSFLLLQPPRHQSADRSPAK